MAEFAYFFPETFKKWKEESNSVIVLEAKTEQELEKLITKYSTQVEVAEFREPDIDNQLTAIAFYASPELRKKLQSLPLAGRSKSVADLIYDMSQTEQTQGQSVLDHGISVHKYYLDLLNKLTTGESKFEWKLPEWLTENSDFILKNQCKLSILQEYQLFHDCGKPYCLTIDEEGKKHFPDHANKSYETYLSYFNNQHVANLIKSDMDIHLLKPSEVEEWMQDKDPKFVLSLLLTTLSELHSNANMFGGIDSTSFKIKFKNFDKVGKNILKNLIK